jgi:tRNA 2-thiouridine synthesizing protein A
MNETVIELDARGFEPPMPLMKTLEAVATLPVGAELRVHTRWRPALLYAELEKRGFVGESQEQTDGSYITHIRHH